MKPMLPTLKEKKRYIVFEAISKVKLNKTEIMGIINKNIKDFLGLLLLNKSGARVLAIKNNKGIIRVNHNFVNEVKASLAMINLPNTIFRSIKTSGTIKKAKNYIGDAI